MAKKERPAYLDEMSRTNPVRVPQDKLQEVRDMIAQVRELELERKGLEEKLVDVRKKLDGVDGYYLKRLPDLMDSIGVSSLSLEAQGNLPAVEAKVGPYYKANIESGWEPERRQAGLKYLDNLGHGDLIKTEVTVVFPREGRGRALAFAQLARQYGNPVLKENIAWTTLSAWLKEQVEDHGVIPDLEKIGGFVGRSVKLKSVKS